MGDKPAILLNMQRQPGANVIDVVNRINALLPQLRAVAAGHAGRDRGGRPHRRPSATRSPTSKFEMAAGRRAGGDGDLPVPAQPCTATAHP